MKPYKLTQYFDTDIHDLEQPVIFKENCLSMAYIMIALFTDLIFDLYKPELERLEGHKLDKAEQIIQCKKKMYQDLMPISDDYVLYTDYSEWSKSKGWSGLVKAMRTYLTLQIE